MTNSTETWSIDNLQDVWHLATKMHDGQKYGGANQDEKIEYINHIASVVFEIIAAVQIDKSLNADLAIKCALLHDTLEDTKLTYDEIVKNYGAQVAEGVKALTKSSSIKDKHEKMTDNLARIKAQPREVWAVKMADRITNLYAPPFYWNNEKKQEYVEEAKLIHRSLCEGCQYLADRLLKKISDYNKYIT